MKKLGLFFLVAAVATLVVLRIVKAEESSVNEKKKAKNVILLIGDGMGVTQVYAAMSVAKDELNMEKFKCIGLHKTYSANDYVTDSGAGGTALATGVKTNNKHVGVDTAGVELKNMLDYAQENLMATGLVSTSSITHATPAAFIAHSISRYEYEDIAQDFLDFDVDIFIGGGKKYFDQREDGLNIVDSLKSKGYTIVDGYENLNTSEEGRFAVFTAEDHNPEVMNDRGNMLPVSTQKAIEVLSKDKDGFFLMVEGSQIDWGGHDNDIEYVVSETLDFDKAVGKALEFAKQDGETLVIVTADHETGGLTITDGNIKEKTIEAKFASEYHTGVIVPVFAYGPGAENFMGIYENTDILNKILKSLGIDKNCNKGTLTAK